MIYHLDLIVCLVGYERKVNMKSFSEEDVLTVARAILTEPLEFMSGDFESYYYCIYCGAVLHECQYTDKNFKHKLDCPVLVAQDLLTGYEKGEDNE